MFEALAKEVGQKGISILDKHEVVSLLNWENKGEKHVLGAVALDKSKLDHDNLGLVVFNAVNVILATGGPAGMYKTSVYPESQTGSTGLALKIGAKGKNLTESQFGLASIKFRWNLSGGYQQVIPRYFSTDQDGSDEREFLNDYFPDPGALSRAIFLKGYQWPFDPRRVENYGSSLIDLLVYQETVQKDRRVFLDYTRNFNGFSSDTLDLEAHEYLKKSDALQSSPIERLKALNQPAIDLYKSNAIDITRESIEIAVCAQHNNGGLKGNIWWESNVRHLFPIGEVNGSHGVYRPGGAALNAGQVGGLRAALYIANRYNGKPPSGKNFQSAAQIQIQQILDQAKNAIRPDADETVTFSALHELQERMTQFGAHIRNPTEIKVAVKDAWTLYRKLCKEGRVDDPKKLPQIFKVRDLCLTHAVYLEAIQEYIDQGGRSRGSYIVLDTEGEKPCAAMNDDWRFALTEKDDSANQKILEIWLDDHLKAQKKWVDVRPIPKEESWFEEVWKEFREDKIIR
jgi:succinate dehydrogenase/fumarate reductase flavoprotein subunit